MIEVSSISKSFKKCDALKDISFNVNDGEILGLLGENGAGKSTLLRILSTMLTPTSGEATINGYDLISQQKEVRKSVGVLFGSEVGLYDRLTARENLEYFANLNGMLGEAAKERIDQLADQFAFREYADKRVSTFSRGMKQKVAIARAIVHDPSVVLLDEPDSGLDFIASRIVFDFMELCRSNNRCIIFSSHSMENIKNYSDRMVVLHKGEIIKEFNVHEYRDKYTDKEINNMLFDLVDGGKDND